MAGGNTDDRSGSIADAGFANVAWEETEDGGPPIGGPTAGLLLGLVGVTGLLLYDYFGPPASPLAFVNWDVSRMDWLVLYATVLLVRYGAYPLARDRDRTRRVLRAVLARPAGAVSVAFILVSFLLALVGPELVWFDYPRLVHRYQPPVFSSVDVADAYSYDCVGRLTDGACHGTWRYPLGTNRFGEPMTELLFYGNRVAVKLALTTAVVMGIVATAVGTTAGYVGGVVDDALMGYVDVQQTLPAVVVYVVLATLFLGNLTGINDGGLFALALVFGLLDWGGIARLVRSDVVTRRSAGYVRAARAAGASDRQVIRQHVVPNSMGTIVTALTRRVPLLVLAQVGLAYLELNRANSRSLGRVLRLGTGSSMNSLAWTDLWWISTFGLLFLVAFVLAYSVFGDVLRDVVDPREEVV